MTDLAIRAEHLSKTYRIPRARGRRRYRTLQEDLLSVPGRVWTAIRGQNRGGRDTVLALRDLSLEVRQGEVVGVIGRNGAGKSTLLKILSRVTDPSEGYAAICGRVVSLLEVGTGFHPELTGRENIYLNGAILGMKRAEIDRRFDEIVSFAETEKFLETPAKRYSSGMYVRLAFAVAAHLDAEIMIVDEVLAVGDALFQKKCLGKMDNVAKGGRTVLFVSHNMEAVRRLCTRAVHLHDGAMVSEGSTDAVITRYLGEETTWAGERVWPDVDSAPGDDVVRVHAVRVQDGDGRVRTIFDVRDPVSIEIEYSVLEQGHRIVVQFYFVNELGHVLFIAKDNLDCPWRDSPRPPGHYRNVCHIPGDFLNEGVVSVWYGIDTVGMTSLIAHATQQDVVRFRVSDRMDPEGVRGNYPLEWRNDGVRPRLSWLVLKD